jgi:hypothetical protein
MNKKDFVLSYPVQSSEPIIEENFRVSLPQRMDLRIKEINTRYNYFNAKLAPEVSQEKGKTVYRWYFKKIPQIIPESNMPPQVEVNPALLLSTFNNWQDVYNWWWPLAKDKIKADEAIKAKVKELTKDAASDEYKLRAIYNFCAQEIRYVAVEYGQAGYEPHKAEDIFRNKYGDCKDQAILLITMLREAGFSASAVLISTNDYYNLNEDFPAVFFNHCIACVTFQGALVFLDPTAQTCQFQDLPSGDQERKVLFCADDGFKIVETPLFPPIHNQLSHKLGVKLNEDESITADKAVLTNGIYSQAQRYWLLFTAPELIRKQLEERIQQVSIGAKLINYQADNLTDLNLPVSLNYNFSGPEYMTAVNNLRILPQLTDLDSSLTAQDKRVYPVYFGVLDAKESDFEIELPHNLSAKFIPADITEDSPWLKFSAEYKSTAQKIYFKQKLEIKKKTITQEEYPAFKYFYENIAKKAKQRIMLQKR